ncbi:MAG: glycosyltransferase [Dysgonamonadaceae bacterium]|jgi:glycosyltransferase involved in cell wall biosynthesis/predicted metal-dependent phosphoesterase TrpH|nr:glycosyltransferase [Dysgonamonadaceae bacterium]
MKPDFQATLREAFEQFVLAQQNKFPAQDVLKIDLHCHDFNSDVPDELIGRILNVPETWLSSEKLIEKLTANGCDTFTITNHNNARSCYALQSKGIDVLTAAEFSCWVPDFEIGIHVLAYGFTPEQEIRLDKLRKNLYQFLEYARAHQIPTIWAHPLYHYAAKKTPPPAFFNKMLLVFERFEVVNGQRDTWQNLLVKEWLEQISPAEIDQYAKEFAIDPLQFCADPYRKSMAGGSDCHTSIFAGMTGTYLYIPDLQQRLQTESRSQLALEAIRNGQTAPFGAYQNTEKMTIAFLDYACQIALNYKDPGLVRLLLHKGTSNDKLIAFLVSNLFCEVQRHKVTTSFIRIFHDSMMGDKPSFLKKLVVKPAYKPIFDEAVNIANKNKENGQQLIDGYYHSILNINQQLYAVLSKRLTKKLKKAGAKESLKDKSLDELIEKLELPSSIRSYIANNEKGKGKNVDVSDFLDGLSFPFFGALFILAAHFTSAKTMFNTRPLLRDFSKRLKRFEHPERVCWLTDTFGDGNGVSVFLKEMLAEIKKNSLPIDLVTCSSTLESEDHLIVLQPVQEFSLPIYGEYAFKIPNFVELHNLFLSGGYDRIICSTEGIMGFFGLYLKHAYSVEASFYMHTDWLMFARKVLNIDGHNLNRVRRMLRSFYKAFDHVFVLNSDQKNWLAGSQMNLNPNKVHQTAHWVNSRFKPAFSNKQKLFGISEEHPVLLYVGRISREKGVLELSSIYKQVKQKYKNIQLVIVGKGPDAEQLKAENPGAVFLDWVGRDQLPEIYSSADLLILPSRFDTFSNVVLEALSCGLPVIAYNTKGPKDIIRDGKDGFLVNNQQEISEKIRTYLGNKKKEAFKRAAVERAATYNSGTIIVGLLKAIGMNDVK